MVKKNKNNSNSTNSPRPFLKWAGGKTQLLDEIRKKLPKDLNKNYKYFEPFVGGGAVFFSLMGEFKFEYAYLGDVNKDLILTYNVIKRKPGRLISLLGNYKRLFDSKKVDNKLFFYRTRELFNENCEDFDPLEISSKNISRAAQMIFLNKTCFNGLYRVNKENKFNVPFANPKNPLICDVDNIYAVSKALKNVDLFVGDFSKCEYKLDEHSFIYLDPPYKPINGKKSFEGYTKSEFDDDEQKRLSEFCHHISKKNIGAKFLLSNSKPDEVYFKKLYPKCHRDLVSAIRAINSNGAKRGAVDELLIYNYADVMKK